MNIRNIQWVTCLPDEGSRLSWYLASAVIPILVVMFGVFLAFSTRNVVFLWNEARQIAWVLYNIFFFLVIIIIVQTFPPDLYVATYYITVVVSYTSASFALAVLFFPKIIAILTEGREAHHLKSPLGGGNDWHPARGGVSGGAGGLSHQRYGPGSVTTDLGPSSGGGFGGQYPNSSLMGSRSGSHHLSNNSDNNASTVSPTGNASNTPQQSIGRSNSQPLQTILTGHPWSRTIESQQMSSSPAPQLPTGPEIVAASVVGSQMATNLLDRGPTTTEILASASMAKKPGFRRMLSLPSHMDAADMLTSENPLNKWMSARLSQMGGMTGPIFSRAGDGSVSDVSTSGDDVMKEGEEASMAALPPSRHLSVQEQEEFIREGGRGYSISSLNAALEPGGTDADHLEAKRSKISQAGASKAVKVFCLLLCVQSLLDFEKKKKRSTLINSYLLLLSIHHLLA